MVSDLSDPEESVHEPVLLAETLDGLLTHSGSTLLDGTLGGGGHTAGFLERTEPTGRVLGLDADPAAIRRVQIRLQDQVQAGRLLLAQGNYEQMRTIAATHRFDPVDNILLDLGVSSFQLESAQRGFSFMRDGPLDMRMDPDQLLDAATIVNDWPEQELANLIFQYGEERQSRRIARYLVNQRPVTTTHQLADLVERAVGGRRGQRLHPATRTFQALRIAVNDELGHLERTLPQALQLLRPGGRLAVISFHSLEDRLVKQWMQKEAQSFIPDRHHPMGGVETVPTLHTITRKPVMPGAEEIDANPRSRSARLRIAQKRTAQG